MIYTSRCNFRCPFCHNPGLVLAEEGADLNRDEVLKTLAERRGFIDGVVITGGEPTVHEELPELVYRIKDLHLMVKLDTNGSNPDMLQRLLEQKCLDSIAMDIKTSLKKYALATGVNSHTEAISRSIGLLNNSGIPCEFRTTCVPGIVDEDDIVEISGYIGETGLYTLQQFQPVSTLDPSFSRIRPYPYEVLTRMLQAARRSNINCRLIGVKVPESEKSAVVEN